MAYTKYVTFFISCTLLSMTCFGMQVPTSKPPLGTPMEEEWEIIPEESSSSKPKSEAGLSSKSPHLASSASKSSPLSSSSAVPKDRNVLNVRGIPISVDFLNNSKHDSINNPDTRIRLIERGYFVLKNLQNHPDSPYVPGKEPVIFTNEFLCPQGITSTVWSGAGKVISAPSSAYSWCTDWYSGKTAEKKTENTMTRRAYLEDIIAVAWAIHNEAFLTRTGEKEVLEGAKGTTLINDMNHALFNFLTGYIRVATGETLNTLHTSVSPLKSNFVYIRDPSRQQTSHFHGETIVQFGIDARFESNGYTMAVFPGGMTHLLTGLIHIGDQNFTFFKLEEYGLGDPSSVASHGIDFLKPSVLNSEKRILNSIAEPFRTLLIQVQDHLDVIAPPETPLRKGVDAVMSAPDLNKITREHIKIREIHEVTEKIKALVDAKKIDDATGHIHQAIEKLGMELDKAGYAKESLPFRTGNEIHLDIRNLASRFPKELVTSVH